MPRDIETVIAYWSLNSSCRCSDGNSSRNSSSASDDNKFSNSDSKCSGKGKIEKNFWKTLGVRNSL